MVLYGSSYSPPPLEILKTTAHFLFLIWSHVFRWGGWHIYFELQLKPNILTHFHKISFKISKNNFLWAVVTLERACSAFVGTAWELLVYTNTFQISYIMTKITNKYKNKGTNKSIIIINTKYDVQFAYDPLNLTFVWKSCYKFYTGTVVVHHIGIFDAFLNSSHICTFCSIEHRRNKKDRVANV